VDDLVGVLSLALLALSGLFNASPLQLHCDCMLALYATEVRQLHFWVDFRGSDNYALHLYQVVDVSGVEVTYSLHLLEVNYPHNHLHCILFGILLLNYSMCSR